MKQYRFPLLLSAAIFVVIGIAYGGAALITLAILAVLEVSFSFDNAVVNAQVLQRLSSKWQTIFITFGILVAAGGMRFAFPILVVMFTAHLGFIQVIHLAVSHPNEYATHLLGAHQQIAMIGGTFLLLIFLDWVFEEREVTWLGPVERLLARAGKLDSLSVIIAASVVLGISLSAASNKQLDLLLCGVFSLTIYKAVNAFASATEEEDEDEAAADAASPKPGRVGWGALMLFLWLELQDASFSFDGVSGAFAVTNKIILIVAGLSIGAVFIRTMTVQFMKSGKLAEFCYLDHGAHWAIGALAVCLLLTIGIGISDYIIGVIGVLFIGTAVLHSLRHNKTVAKLESPEPVAALSNS